VCVADACVRGEFMVQLPCVLDVDTGEDDALAILLACAYKLPLAAIVTSYGNTSLDHATANTAAILQLAGATHVPVIRGSATPLVPHPHPEAHAGAGDFVGANGLCDVTLPPAHDVVVHRPGHDDLAATLMHLCGSSVPPIRYVVTGPCTNLARILRQLGARAHSVIGEIIVMATAIHTPGNSGPVNATGQQCAEFNCYCDATAFAEILSSGLPITVVSWDVTASVTIAYPVVCGLTASDAVGSFVVSLMRAFLERYGLAHAREFEFNDPLTIWMLRGNGRFRTVMMRISTDLHDYGATYEDDSGTSVRFLEPLSADETRCAVDDMLGAVGVSA